MKLIDYTLETSGRSDEIHLYPIGDTHIGARTCAEHKIKSLVDLIKSDKQARWIGLGDMIDCIKPQDAKRYEPDVLPDWMFDGGAELVRVNLNDVVGRQASRLVEMVKPIKDKCLGMIEGNHEYSIRKHYNESIHDQICRSLGVPDLTDESVIRLVFSRSSGAKAAYKVYCQHGHGGGRTAGIEYNRLDGLLKYWDVDIAFRGHSHTAASYPVTRLTIPSSGKLRLQEQEAVAINHGCFKLAHMEGPSTYESRACYPVRSMLTYYVIIRPWAEKHKLESRQLYL